MPRTVGSILHGAYGDYYWQAVCLRLFRHTHPDIRLRLYAASESRRQALSVLDLSFAECFEPWTALQHETPDEFLQYQVFDPDLRRDVLAHLPERVLARIDRTTNRIFWNDLRSRWPLVQADIIGLNEAGRCLLPEIMAANGIPENLFERRPTVGFSWRYRVSTSAIKPWLQPSAEELVRKYSCVFRRLIDEFDCHVLVTGMNVVTTDANRQRIDAKYAEFGLDLPPERVVYLQGLSWPIEREIISRATVCAGMASGFTEAVCARRGRMFLLDPPLHYLLVLARYRVGLFDYRTPGGFLRAWLRPQTGRRIYRWLAGALRESRATDLPSRDREKP